jgi:isopenicillin N synthase-like dioxygenase
MDYKRDRGFLMKFLAYPTAVVTALSFFACIAAIPIAIKYAKSKEGYIAEAEIPAPAEKVYRAALSMAEERAPEVKILKKDDEKLVIEVTDDIQKASLKAEPITPENTGVIIKADVPKVEGKEKEYEKEQEKELALRILKNLCTKLNVHCTVTNK